MLLLSSALWFDVLTADALCCQQDAYYSLQSSIQYMSKLIVISFFYLIADIMVDVFLKGDTTFHAFQTLVPTKDL